jgi:hypothetical protein
MKEYLQEQMENITFAFGKHNEGFPKEKVCLVAINWERSVNLLLSRSCELILSPTAVMPLSCFVRWEGTEDGA